MYVRQANVADLDFMDSLQANNTHEIGFLPRHALEVFVVCEKVFIGFENDEPAGYVLGRGAQPKHLTRGQITQAVIQYDLRHRAMGAALVGNFVRSLESSCDHLVLWCAQDLEANLFWESQGFEAMAWRLGKKAKGRLHILWHRPVELDAGRTSFIRPPVTSFGMQDGPRIVVPVRPGEDWRTIKPSQRHDVLVHGWGEPKVRKVRGRKPTGQPVPRIPMITGGRVQFVRKSLYDGLGQPT